MTQPPPPEKPPTPGKDKKKFHLLTKFGDVPTKREIFAKKKGCLPRSLSSFLCLCKIVCMLQRALVRAGFLSLMLFPYIQFWVYVFYYIVFAGIQKRKKDKIVYDEQSGA